MKTLLITLGLTLVSPLLFAQQTAYPLPVGLMVEGSFGAGRGFEQVAVFTTTTGEDATISAGGGVSGQLGVAYYSPFKLQVAIHGGASISELGPTLDNAHATFRRFTLTPEIRYPIEIKPGHNITVGTGYGLYTGARYYEDGRELAGYELYSYYEPATGVHFLAEYQSATSDKAAISFGLRGYATTYLSREVVVNDISLGDLGEDRNGGGIELFLRISYGGWFAPED